MKVRIALVFIAILCAGKLTHAQTAAEIIDKHINAIGGNTLIATIKSQEMENTLSVMGSELTSKVILLVGKGYKNEADFNGQKIIQCITPTAGWSLNALSGMTKPEPMPDDNVKMSQSLLHVGGDLYQYKEKGSSVTLEGTEMLEGVKTYKLKLTDKESKVFYLFIDASTYFLIRRENTQTVNGQAITTHNVYYNFKKTDIGFTMPFSIISDQGFEVTIQVEKVVFNKEVDPKIFQMPKE